MADVSSCAPGGFSGNGGDDSDDEQWNQRRGLPSVPQDYDIDVEEDRDEEFCPNEKWVGFQRSPNGQCFEFYFPRELCHVRRYYYYSQPYILSVRAIIERSFRLGLRIMRSANRQGNGPPYPYENCRINYFTRRDSAPNGLANFIPNANGNNSLGNRGYGNNSLGNRGDGNNSLGNRGDGNNSLGNRGDGNNSLGNRGDVNNSLGNRSDEDNMGDNQGNEDNVRDNQEGSDSSDNSGNESDTVCDSPRHKFRGFPDSD